MKRGKWKRVRWPSAPRNICALDYRFSDCGKLTKISLSSLFATQRLVEIKTVRKYSKEEEYAPISVGVVAGGYAIIDGHHRATAMRECGYKKIWAIVREIKP
jgi:hypothetical protein